MNYSKKYLRFLFALQLALLPMIIFGHLMFDKVLPLLFFVGVIVARLWSLAFVNKLDKQDTILMSIADFVNITFCAIYIVVVKDFSLAFSLVVMLLNVALLVLQILQFNKPRTDFLIAMEFSFKFFAYGALLLAFIPADLTFWSKASMLSASIVGVVALGFKLYYYLREKTGKKKY